MAGGEQSSPDAEKPSPLLSLAGTEPCLHPGPAAGAAPGARDQQGEGAADPDEGAGEIVEVRGAEGAPIPHQRELVSLRAAHRHSTLPAVVSGHEIGAPVEADPIEGQQPLPRGEPGALRLAV